MKKLVALFLAVALCLGLAAPAFAAEVTTVVPFGKYDRIGGEVQAVFSEGLMMVCKDGKWGYIDTAGREVIPCRYDDAHNFFDGLALVVKDGQYGYIDTTGREVIPCQYDWGFYFYDGLSQVSKDGQSFFIDKTGSKVFSCPDECFYEDFSEGLVVTEKQDGGPWNSQYGYTDTTGRVVIPFQYDDAYPFSDGLAVVGKDGKYGYIDKTGQVVIPLRYDQAYDFTDGLAAVSDENGGGYIDKTGKEVIPCQYDLAGSFFEDGLAAVDKDGKYGYIDTTGRMVVPCQYEMAWDFADGMARVANADGEYGFVDTTGREVIPCQYEQVQVHDFNEGLAMLIGENGKWGYIDKTGRVVIPCQYDAAFDFSEGRAAVMKDGKWGLIAYNGGVETEQPAQSIAFTDVPANAYFAEAVDWAVEQGITNGTGANVFSPNNTCTTAQILTFLWRAAGCPAPAGSNVSVPAGEYYSDAANWALEQGLTDSFDANAPATRAATVTYLWKLAGSPEPTGANPFADVTGDARAMVWAMEQGVTTGTTATTFNPDATCTRGQIVTFLHRNFVK